MFTYFVPQTTCHVAPDVYDKTFSDSLIRLQVPWKLQFLSIFVLPEFSAMLDINVPHKCV